jgi:CspA family cold shock protein
MRRSGESRPFPTEEPLGECPPVHRRLLAALLQAVLEKAGAEGKLLVPTGRVKWFDPKKGYGFIVPDDGSRDLFVHITAVKKAGYSDLVQGLRVTYEIRPDREGNPTAESLRFG